MSENTKREQHEFQSEAKQVLELMIHSVYSNPDIFLRELISNASDALDKLRIESLSDEALAGAAGESSIVITVDKSARTLTISDNGIGMSHDELVSYLGTIARSGTGEFIRAMREASAAGGDLIGQFGVGFYSSFIVADLVTVRTRKAGDETSWLWSSAGDGLYTVEPGDREANGTDVILHVKEGAADADDAVEQKDYLSTWTLREIIKKYSDFVSYPIYLKEADGKTQTDEPVNSMKALWIRPETDVTDEEYDEFYRHITHDWEEPMERIVYRAEGTNEFHALLYIPSHPPMDLFYREGRHGIQLYIRRVFIMNDCRDLIPEYLRFVKGVVDSEDLPLNVSREILQQDRQTAAIKRSLTRKVLDTLKKLKQEKPDDYKKFWGMFGVVLKEGLVSDAKNRDALLKLGLFATSAGGMTTLDDYVGKMKEGQKSIYYLSGGPADVLATSPKLEAFRKRDIEVLLLGDPVDEIWTASVGRSGDHPFVSASAADLEIEGEEAPRTEEETAESQKLADSGFLSRLKDALAGGGDTRIEDVRISTRLVDSPATFVQTGDPISPHMRGIFKAMGQEMPPERRALEINPTHPLVQRASDELSGAPDDKELAGEWGTLLSALAAISDGETVERGQDFIRTLGRLLER